MELHPVTRIRGRSHFGEVVVKIYADYNARYQTYLSTNRIYVFATFKQGL